MPRLRVVGLNTWQCKGSDGLTKVYKKDQTYSVDAHVAAQAAQIRGGSLNILVSGYKKPAKAAPVKEYEFEDPEVDDTELDELSLASAPTEDAESEVVDYSNVAAEETVVTSRRGRS